MYAGVYMVYIEDTEDIVCRTFYILYLYLLFII